MAVVDIHLGMGVETAKARATPVFGLRETNWSIFNFLSKYR
jgi:hypothetical protein